MTLAPGLLLIASLIGEDPSDHHGHEAKPYDYREFTVEEKERVGHLFRHIICACPKENWTKTLAGCPDGCADPQKGQVRAAVKAGKSNQEILDDQLRRYGPQVLSVPDSRLAHLVPYLTLAFLGVVVLALLARAVRPSRAAREAAPAKAAPPPPEGSEEARLEAAVERDLREMEE